MRVYYRMDGQWIHKYWIAVECEEEGEGRRGQGILLHYTYLIHKISSYPCNFKGSF